MPVNSFADKLVKKIFGSSSDIFLKSAKPIVAQINDLEPQIEKLSDDELKAQTPKFKGRIAAALVTVGRVWSRAGPASVLHRQYPSATSRRSRLPARVTRVSHNEC